MSELEDKRRQASEAFSELGLEAEFISLGILAGGTVTIAELARRFEACEQAWRELVDALQPQAVRDVAEWIDEE